MIGNCDGQKRRATVATEAKTRRVAKAGRTATVTGGNSSNGAEGRDGSDGSNRNNGRDSSNGGRVVTATMVTAAYATTGRAEATAM